jgi:hypothetical protein
VTAPLTVRTELDWDEFVDRFWDKAPVLIRGVAPAPFEEREVFDAAVAGTRPAHPLTMPPNTQFTVERRQQLTPSDLLPRPADGDLAGYERRLAHRLDGRRYALVVNGFHTFHYPQWDRERTCYRGLWERVGVPVSAAITTMFHGTYEHSPVGVHKDRFATFMFCLRGRKRMRFWGGRPWTAPVSTVLDYGAYLDDSLAVDAGPGDLLYWPSSYYHVGESAGAEPATSVNVGIPREHHHARYELGDLLADGELASVADPAAALDYLPSVSAPLLTPHDTGDLLPPALSEALTAIRGRCAPDRLRDHTVALTLRHATADGLHPVPPPAPPAPLPAAVRAVTPIATAGSPTGSWYAANGHATHTDLPLDTLTPLVAALRADHPTPTTALLALAPRLREVLDTLNTFHALSPGPET